MAEVNIEEVRGQSPCLSCQRVRDPGNCENKLCKEWQAWFIARWEAMRAGVRDAMQRKKTVEETISVGGHKYSHPDRVREYLEQNPCRTCACPESLCETPCAVRKAWNEQKEKRGCVE